MNIHDWARRWNISHQALQELLDMPLPNSDPTAETEGAVQAQVRLTASKIGAVLWRNNNGACVTDEGRHLRFGLGNDSKKINEKFKSSDLIGITPMRIGEQHLNKVVGLFTAFEIKHGSWYWTGTAREHAQWKYIQLVNHYGGIAGFAKSTKDYEECLLRTLVND